MSLRVTFAALKLIVTMEIMLATLRATPYGAESD